MGFQASGGNGEDERATPCDLLRSPKPSRVSRFLSHFRAGPHVLPKNSATLTNLSGSFLRSVPHRLAWSRTRRRLSGSAIRQKRLERGQDRPWLLDRLRRTREKRLGNAAVVGGLTKIK